MTVAQDHLRGTACRTAGSQEPPPRLPSAIRCLVLALMCCGVALVVWLWAGLGALEALGLAATGVLLLRRDPRRCLTAAATAALMVVDAWFDVLTSLPGTELATALAMALGAELPLATLCVVLAVLPCRATRPQADLTRTLHTVCPSPGEHCSSRACAVSAGLSSLSWNHHDEERLLFALSPHQSAKEF